MTPKGSKNDPKMTSKAQKTRPQSRRRNQLAPRRPKDFQCKIHLGAVGFSARSPVRSCVRCWVGLVGCALAYPPPLRGRRARSPCPVLGPSLGPTLGVMSLDAPAQFFRVFVVFVPLQKSSPAPAHPTSPPLKAATESLKIFFTRPETSSQNDIFFCRFGGALGVTPFMVMFQKQVKKSYRNARQTSLQKLSKIFKKF